MGRMTRPRVAFFPDSFHEVNGVAHTARQLVGFAERRGYPLLCFRAGPGAVRLRSESVRSVEAVEVVEFRRSRWAFRLEQDLFFDPFFFRYGPAIGRALRAFRPEVIHITGPSELGLLGAWFAWRLGVPLVASWHTNVHEYAGRRLAMRLRAFGAAGAAAGRVLEALTLSASAWFYRLARVVFAPNPELCTLLAAKVGRPCELMTRGVDTELFSPVRRSRPNFGGEPGEDAAGKDAAGTPETDGVSTLMLGYVGRLSVEKNTALLPEVDRALRAAGLDPRWSIVGHGTEQAALQRQLGGVATFPGVLKGRALAEAFAAMDLLVFPSHTDTFGNVVLEALASGVPAVVTPDGGPAHTVRDGVTGWVAADAAFASAVEAFTRMTPEAQTAMRAAAREHALGCSWDAVFERVFAVYKAVVTENRRAAPAAVRSGTVERGA